MTFRDTSFGIGFKLGFGAGLIMLGIVTWVITGKYIFPLGSIIAILCGIFSLYWGIQEHRKRIEIIVGGKKEI